MGITPRFGQGVFVPTTQIWDIEILEDIDINTPEFKELLVRMYQQIGNIANNLNIKDTGYYDTDEYVCGRLYFPNPAFTTKTAGYPNFRQVFRKTINFGALPNAATKSVIHNITTVPGATTFTHIYATATDPVSELFIPIPFASPTLNQNIKINVDTTNINITTAINYSAYTVCYVVLEWIQN